MDFNTYLQDYNKTLIVANNVATNTYESSFTDYDKKIACLFFIRSNYLQDFSLSVKNNELAIIPQSGFINDAVLKSIFENAKGAIDYINYIINSYFANFPTNHLLRIFLCHFFTVTDHRGFYFSKSPLAYGPSAGINKTTKFYQELEILGIYPEKGVIFTPEEITIIIALASLSNKLTKIGENITESIANPSDYYLPMYKTETYHYDLIDTIIDNYPELFRKITHAISVYHNQDLLIVHRLLRDYYQHQTIANIRDVDYEEKEKYKIQLQKEIAFSSGKDIAAYQKLMDLKTPSGIRLTKTSF